MSIFWVEHDAPLSSSSFLSLSFHLTPSRLFCPLTLLSLSPSLFEGKQLCRSGAKEQATMSLPPAPPRARVCLGGRKLGARPLRPQSRDVVAASLCLFAGFTRTPLPHAPHRQTGAGLGIFFIPFHLTFFPTLNLFGCR